MPSKFKIEIRAELRDSLTGRLLKRFPWVKANSLLKQFIQMVAVQLSQANITVTDVDNVDRSVAKHAAQLGVDGAALAVDKGILIGTGTTAVAMTDYKVQTILTAGMTYGINTFAIENPDASTWRLAISRIFTNGTGASVGIREVVIYAWDSQNYKFCIDRTLYSVDVPNGVAITMTYRISISL